MPIGNSRQNWNGGWLKPLDRRAYLSGAASRGSDDAAKGHESPCPTPALSRAGARRAPEKVSKVRPDAEEILRLILARIDDMKAEDTVTIDLTGKILDRRRHGGDVRPVQPPGRRHRRSRCSRTCARPAFATSGSKGMPHCDWVLIDAGDVIVHVFRPEVRAFYALEKMWARRGRADGGQADPA